MGKVEAAVMEELLQLAVGFLLHGLNELWRLNFSRALSVVVVNMKTGNWESGAWSLVSGAGMRARLAVSETNV